jgi:membrane-associated phospholipid phosphatase
MSKNQEFLAKNALIIIAIIWALTLVIGLILLGLGFNEAFYSADPLVQAIFTVITNLGEPIVFVILVAIFYIVYDKKYAKNLTLSLLLAIYTKDFLKDIFMDPRPPTNVDPGEITPENPQGLIWTGYGFPSGHAQTAVGFWGYKSYEFKDNPKFRIIPIIPTILSVLIFLIAISRIIIGVHDLQDIIGGLLFGIGFLIAFIYLEPMFSEKFNTLKLSAKLIIGIAISLILFIIAILLFPTSGEALLPNPTPYADSGGYAQVGGVLLGLSVGYPLENEYIKYEPSEISLKQKIVNLIVGMVLLLVIYFVLDFLVEGNVIFRFIRYAIIGLVLTLIVPYIFTKINRF